MSTFDVKAATWDEHPPRRALAQAIVAGITTTVPLRQGMRILDVGCGTGLIGLPLATGAASVLGVDLSAGMVERFTAKAVAAGLDHARGEVRDLLATPLPPGCIDLAVSAMAFHHIADTAGMLAAVAAALAPDGWLAIADLEREDGSFHDESVPHPGFDPTAFRDLLVRSGLREAAVRRVFVMERPDRPRTYPVFLATARAAG